MNNAERLAGLSQPRDVKEITKGIIDSFVDTDRDEFVKKTTFSPSRLAWNEGRCPRYWYFLFKGVQHKETITSFAKNNMANGTDAHERLQKQISEGPLEVVIEEQLRYSDPPINSFCDVIVEYQGKRVPIEIKTCSQVAYEYRESSRKAADYHILQLLVYMKILDTDLGFIMYENKNGYDKLMIPVRMTPELKAYIDDAFEWMRNALKAFEEDTMPTYFKGRRKNSKMCGRCPIKESCDAAGQGVVDLPLLKEVKV